MLISKWLMLDGLQAFPVVNPTWPRVWRVCNVQMLLTAQLKEALHSSCEQCTKPTCQTTFKRTKKWNPSELHVLRYEKLLQIERQSDGEARMLSLKSHSHFSSFCSGILSSRANFLHNLPLLCSGVFINLELLEGFGSF